MAFDWKTLIPIFETAGNIAELALAPELVPLTQAAEAALNPLLMKIGSGTVTTSADVQNEVMAFYGTAIAALNLAKQKTGLDPAVVTKINEYLAASMDGMTAYFAAGQAFNPDNYKPVTPIA